MRAHTAKPPARANERRLLGAALFSLCANVVAASPPSLSFPLDCTLGQTCVIEDYVDVNPTNRQADFACGQKSRNGHRGTDISLLSYAQMHSGVAVLAAAPGTVSATRDGMADTRVTPETRASLMNKGCGNAVIIKHENGWETRYCHLKNGSLRVKSGQTVSRGEPLAQVGLSGLTNFPHLHIGLHHNGRTIDPFDPTNDPACDPSAQTLWETTPTYDPGILIDTGFTPGIPDFKEVRSGRARKTTLPRTTPALVLYGYAANAQAGDTLTFTAFGPNGQVLDHTLSLDAPRRSFFRAFGRKTPPQGWPAGDYIGKVILKRGEKVVAVRFTYVTLTR